MVHKTNAARFLDGKHIPYELVEYEVDESDLSAVHVAAVCGEQIEKIYKTIVCECEPRGYVVACIQGDLSLNLKALARLSGHKKCELLNLRERLRECRGARKTDQNCASKLDRSY